jgi:hypothetical protein
MKTNIREYNEEMKVVIKHLSSPKGEYYKDVISKSTYNAFKEERYVISALNEGGCNSTQVDLIDVLKFVKKNIPKLWNLI